MSHAPGPGYAGRSRGWPAPAAGGLPVGVVLTVLAVVGLSWESTTVVHTARQPASVTHADGSDHHLAVERLESVLGGTRHELRLGRDPGLDHGHSVALGFTGTDPAPVETRWTAEGVEVLFASGHAVRVPAASFTGGR